MRATSSSESEEAWSRPISCPGGRTRGAGGVGGVCETGCAEEEASAWAVREVEVRFVCALSTASNLQRSTWARLMEGRELPLYLCASRRLRR